MEEVFGLPVLRFAGSIVRVYFHNLIMPLRWLAYSEHPYSPTLIQNSLNCLFYSKLRAL